MREADNYLLSAQSGHVSYTYNYLECFILHITELLVICCHGNTWPTCGGCHVACVITKGLLPQTETEGWTPLCSFKVLHLFSTFGTWPVSSVCYTVSKDRSCCTTRPSNQEQPHQLIASCLQVLGYVCLLLLACNRMFTCRLPGPLYISINSYMFRAPIKFTNMIYGFVVCSLYICGGLINDFTLFLLLNVQF